MYFFLFLFKNLDNDEKLLDYTNYSLLTLVFNIKFFYLRSEDK